MSHQGTRATRTKAGYVALDEDDDKDPRVSTSSSSPILPASELGGVDDEAPLKPSTFQVDGLETFYKPIEGYEGLHRYDPEYTWSSADEGRVVRKVSPSSLDCLICIPLTPS
jgi:MFS transporter, ACS family, DAL5 transporter family protein